MRISEYIGHLEALKSEHGDIEVECDFIWQRKPAPPPAIAYKKILKPRERKPDFWSEIDSEGQKGEKVVRV
jgi:hypothetical protein